MQLIVTYQVGEPYVYSADEVRPAVSDSVESFLEELEARLVGYDPAQSDETFVCGGQTFEYRRFVHHYERQVTKRRSVDDWMFVMPTVQTVEQWFTQHMPLDHDDSVAPNSPGAL